ncbi:uncharacterized protein LOC143032573 [Oratosquilla oratoria]|uniref:uncharacterized protein LOC143032573 n=1 Tax=Oratosquilla oratoria TaxID=337810 RepID=UPI003F7598C5
MGIFKALMNKLSPKNFDRISEQVAAFLAKHPGTAETAAELIVDFSTRQQFYSRAYAWLSKMLTEKLGKEIKDVFKTRLVSKCQLLFEPREKTEASCENNNLTHEERAESELKKISCRKRYAALCVFIASLCLEDLIPARRLAYCTQFLLKRRDETSLEAVCALLQVVGHKMDEVAGTSPIGTQEV